MTQVLDGLSHSIYNLCRFLNIFKQSYNIFYTYFYCLYLCGTKSFVLKPEPYFTLFFDWFEMAFSITVSKVMCFWCSLYKVIGNKGLFSYSRYKLLGVSILSTKTYFPHYVINYIEKTLPIRYTIPIIDVMFLCA